MKLLASNFKKGFIKVQIDNLEDLWHVSAIIDKGDMISASTIRKIKLGDAEDRNAKVIKKHVFLDIIVEKVEFHKYNNILRVSGTVLEGKEDIPKGSYHTIQIDEGTKFSLQKQNFMDFQIKKIKEACEEKKANILLVVMDREEAHFALLRNFGYQALSSIKGDVAKKVEGAMSSGNFYGDIEKALKEYLISFKIEYIVLASNSFFKEDFMKSIKDDDLKKKITLATCSSTDKTAFNELLKRTEVESLLKKERSAKELKFVEKLLEEISKEGKATYGIDEVKKCADAGAVEVLLVSDELIQRSREEEKYEKIENILKLVDASKAEIIIVSSDNDAGKRLDGLSGIGAILRYKMEY